MKQVLMKQGGVVVAEVPAPTCEPGTVLVRVERSCISVGTELAGMASSGKSLVKRVLTEPENVKAGLEILAKNGASKTYKIVRGELDAGRPTGYSAAGTIVEVGAGVADLRVGDPVACAGAAEAHHAQFIRVPRNLVVPVPAGVSMDEAATVTLGAIALQGVRRANPTLGETVVVIGLGVLGQLTVRLLKANGCHVIGSDLDPARVDQAMSAGMDASFGGGVSDVERLSNGVGADAVIITASSPSDDIVSQAFQMCRRKARVVVVGDVGLALRRADMYVKELDLLMSTSYGPGRYDDRYEQDGHDYPVGYVRWTENRNMQAYLDLIQSRRLDLGDCLTASYNLDDAPAAYDALQSSDRPLLVILTYHDEAKPEPRMVELSNARPGVAGPIRMAIIGAGSFVRSVHLPNIESMPGIFQIETVCTRTGPNAVEIGKRYGAAKATTDSQAAFQDVDAALIGTRHDDHGKQVVAAIEYGCHVLVEKPLCLNRTEMAAIDAAIDSAGAEAPIVLTGFNRRFSPLVAPILDLVKRRTGPMVITYRMNAGMIPLDSWMQGAQGGGRNIGEACHIYDLFTALTQSPVQNVQVLCANATAPYTHRDNFVVQMSFEDGSVAQLVYTALGNKEHPKEQMEVFVDGYVAKLDDYQELRITGRKNTVKRLRRTDKGHKEELRRFGEAIQSGEESPIPWWQQKQAMDIAFTVEDALT